MVNSKKYYLIGLKSRISGHYPSDRHKCSFVIYDIQLPIFVQKKFKRKGGGGRDLHRDLVKQCLILVFK